MNIRLIFIGIITLLSVSFFSCSGQYEEGSNPNSKFIGLWVSAETETSIETDIIEFRSETALIAGLEYQYEAKNDSLILTIEDPLLSITIRSAHHYFFSESDATLFIEQDDDIFAELGITSLIELKRAD